MSSGIPQLASAEPLGVNHRLCMSDRIRAVLEERIINGTLLPGDRLIELSIAKEFATSQTPVREALRGLRTMRLVESTPYCGTCVREIGDQEMVEAYTVRGALEELAGDLAAPHLTGNVASLRETIRLLHLAAETGDPEAYSKHNFAFHREIVQACGNQILLDAWDQLGFEMRVRIHLSRQHDPKLVARAAEHTPIIDALERGDGELAGKLLRAHAESCKQRWQERPRAADGKSGTPPGELQAPASCLS